MLKTVIVIIISVTIVGILFFMYVKKKIRDHLNYLLSKKK